VCRGHARLSVRADSRLTFGSLDDVRHEEGPRHRADAPGADEEQLTKLEAPVEEDLRASQNKLVNYLAGHENVMAKYDKLEEEASKA